jgi:hypothetical protein
MIPTEVMIFCKPFHLCEGGPDGFRSRYLLIDNQALSQLSYKSVTTTFVVGVPDWNRTSDAYLFRVTLYQLSYGYMWAVLASNDLDYSTVTV